MADVHRRLTGMQFLRGLSHGEFAQKAGESMGDVNYVYPFREGNGRTQLLYLRQLARQAGHELSATLDPERWIAASIAAHRADYGLLSQEIERALRELP